MNNKIKHENFENHKNLSNNRLRAIIYDLEIDLLKMSLDPILLELKKDLHLPLNEIKRRFFIPNYYFFMINKINFESLILSSFNDYELTMQYIKTLKKQYISSIKLDMKKKDALVNSLQNLEFEIYFSGSIDALTVEQLCRVAPEFEKRSFFSSDLGCAKPDFLFYETIINSLNYDAEEILIVDDNLEALNSAKSIGFYTLFYDGKYDLKGMILNNILHS